MSESRWIAHSVWLRRSFEFWSNVWLNPLLTVNLYLFLAYHGPIVAYLSVWVSLCRVINQTALSFITAKHHGNPRLFKLVIKLNQESWSMVSECLRLGPKRGTICRKWPKLEIRVKWWIISKYFKPSDDAMIFKLLRKEVKISDIRILTVTALRLSVPKGGKK